MREKNKSKEIWNETKSIVHNSNTYPCLISKSYLFYFYKLQQHDEMMNKLGIILKVEAKAVISIIYILDYFLSTSDKYSQLIFLLCNIYRFI